MKTLSILIVKSSIIITAASLFFLTSCSKEELAAPALSESSKSALNPKPVESSASDYASLYANSTARYAIDKIEPPKYGFTSIRIDHRSQTNAPDYSVIVRQDGWLTFQGRKNCAFNHTVTFYMTQHNLSLLQNLYLNANFFDIDDNLQLFKGLPGITTTCSEIGSEATKTLVDFNKGYPADLIQFRTKAESLMGIAQYIGYEE